MRRTLKTAVLLLAFVLIAPAALATGGGGKPGPLDILLTNDDGIDAAGIQTMKAALRAAGHNVTVVAPMENMSGSSASITLDAIPIQEVAPDEYAAGASPATCVLIALSYLELDPDLIVSGTNIGANIGRTVTVSGTVGATIGGLLADEVGIAFSGDPTLDEDDPNFADHYADIADFAVRLIARLQKTSKGDEILPEGTTLNVNYPALDPEDVGAVKVTRQNLTSTGGTSLVFVELFPGLLVPDVSFGEPTNPPDRHSDEEAIGKGDISITALDGDYTANPLVSLGTAIRLKGLQP